MSLQACTQGTHTVTEPSAFCICCAGGRGSFTHTFTHTHYSISLFSPALSVYDRVVSYRSKSLPPIIPVTPSVSLAVFYFSTPFTSLPLLHCLFLSFSFCFSKYKDHFISHTFLLFPPHSLSSIFSSCCISKKLTFQCFFLETGMKICQSGIKILYLFK